MLNKKVDKSISVLNENNNNKNDNAYAVLITKELDQMLH